ncbi:MAG: phosphoribosyltransferase family protein [Bacteroidota bacterium]
MQLLDKEQIKQKIRRLAIQILENNLEEEEIILAGINNNGLSFAKLLHKQLKKISDIPVSLTRIRLSPARPTEEDVQVEMPLAALHQKAIIIVDDVANTGRTIFYAFQPLLQVLPRKVEVAVLVDRKHKSFPIEVNYWGLSLATTLQEHIEVNLKRQEDFAVFLS